MEVYATHRIVVEYKVCKDQKAGCYNKPLSEVFDQKRFRSVDLSIAPVRIFSEVFNCVHPAGFSIVCTVARLIMQFDQRY